MAKLYLHVAATMLGLCAAAFCAAAPLNVQVLDPQGKPLPGAVLSLQGEGRGSAVPSADMDQVKQEFVPHVLAVHTGTNIRFPNSDNIRHQVYSFSAPKRFELRLYEGTPANPLLFDKPGVVVLGCNIHDWMLGYIYVTDDPWFAVSGADGSLRLDVPPGHYQVTLWHPQLPDMQTVSGGAIDVAASGLQRSWNLTVEPLAADTPMLLKRVASAMPSIKLSVKLRSSFQARIACVLILLLLVVIAALTLSVKVATTDAVRVQATDQLQVGARVFERLLDARGKRLKDAAQLLAADFGFRDAVASGDSATIRSALANHGSRIGASDMILLGMDGKVMASTVAELQDGSQFHYDQALRDARRQNQSMLIVPLRGEPHLLVEAPVMAPLPIGRVVVGFVMDAALARELHALTNLQVSFLSREDGQLGQLVSTQPAELQASITDWMLANGSSRQVSLATQDHRRYLSQPLMLADTDGGQVIALLQSPLDEALHAFSALDNTILVIALAALAASLAGALLLARSVSQPVQVLAQAAERIGDGDYKTPVDLNRGDELGVLAKAFNHMREGIAEREQQLAHNALHDSLTGLPNRTLAMERLSSAIAAGRPMALVYLGVDNLRTLSEGAGPAFVDGLLQQMAQRLQATLSPGDTLAHLIADEFLLLLEHTDSDSAVARADKLQQLLLKPHRFGGHDVALDCRIGIAAYPADGSNAEELLGRAAVALKDASLMPGRLQVYEHGRDLAHQRQIRLIRDLRRAADNGELLLNYQPKLDIRQGEVRQAEALLRWHHPQLGIVSPGEFIELAERTGSIQLLTRWVIEEGIRQLGEWNGRGMRVQLSLNISADDLLGQDLAERVTRLLALYGVPPGQLIFEITESAVMREPESALKVLNRLREVGISLSVDDFGTGYSSLAHLKRLPVQELKIDQSFVRNLDETSEDAVIVRSTIEMSHNLGLKVVAEGVEYAHSLRLLERWHCDTAQGYLISRPLTAAAFEAWLKQPLHSLSAMVH